eukprot:350649-Chlamydomonas_euryale.AAC.4
MTHEVCQQRAIEGTYSFFALQFGRECWLSKGWPRAIQYGLSDNCTMPCTGNPAQRCGGWLAFELFTRGPCPSPPPPPPPPTNPPLLITWTFVQSSVAECNATKDTVYNTSVVPVGANNNTAVRCSNTTAESITVSTRFFSEVDWVNVLSQSLDMSKNASMDALAASGGACTDVDPESGADEQQYPGG